MGAWNPSYTWLVSSSLFFMCTLIFTPNNSLLAAEDGNVPLYQQLFHFWRARVSVTLGHRIGRQARDIFLYLSSPVHQVCVHSVYDEIKYNNADIVTEELKPKGVLRRTYNANSVLQNRADFIQNGHHHLTRSAPSPVENLRHAFVRPKETDSLTFRVKILDKTITKISMQCCRNKDAQ